MPELPRHTLEQLDLLVRLNDELHELHESIGGYAAVGVTVAQARFERWRERSTDEIRRVISPEAASELAALPVRPRPGRAETLLGVIEQHYAFFVSLTDDIVARPDHYPDPATQTKRKWPTPKKSSPAPAARLTPPGREKVTLEWLRIHVPMHYWGVVIVGLLALLWTVFRAGVQLGHNEAFVRTFAPILQIDGRPDTSQQSQ